MISQKLKQFYSTKRITSVFIAGVLLFLVLTNLLLSPGVAFIADEVEDDLDEKEDEDNDGIEDEVENHNERQVEVEVQDYEANIESELKLGDTKNNFHIELKASEDLEIQFDFDSDTESGEAELEFTIRFIKLVEFYDTDQDGAYSENHDQFLQEKIFDDVGFRSIVYYLQPATDTSPTVYIFNITTNDDVFSLQTYVSSEFYILNQALVSPAQMKMDIAVNNFLYSNISSKLALQLELESETEYEIDDNTEDEKDDRSIGEIEVETTINNFTGYFSWKNVSYVDGAEYPVLNNDISTEDDSQVIYLNYFQGNKIYHDPKIGIEGILQLNPSVLTEIIESFLFAFQISKESYLIAMIFVTILVILGIGFYRRKN
jgi:hypothetical protein